MYIVKDERGIRYISAEEPTMLPDGSVQAEDKVFTRIRMTYAADMGLPDEDRGPLAIKTEEDWTPEERAEVEALQQAGLPQELFLHVELAGGDGMDPIGIENNGVAALDVSASLRLGAEPDSPAVPVTESWRVEIRDASGHVYDIVKVSMVDGIATFAYTTRNMPALCHIEEGDLGDVTAGGETYRIRLAAPVEFKVYRVL